jgi:hypothetical protein
MQEVIMYHILITTYCGTSSVHTATVGFASETQAVAAAEIINSNATIDNARPVYRHATMLFVPGISTGTASTAEPGMGIPGIDRDTINRVVDRLGQAVKNVEQSKALEQVRSGLDRFVTSAEQLIRRQTTGPRPGAEHAAGGDVESETRGPADVSSAGMAQARKIRYVRATDPTDEQISAARRSAIAANGEMTLVWVNAADLLTHEEVTAPRE